MQLRTARFHFPILEYLVTLGNTIIHDKGSDYIVKSLTSESLGSKADESVLFTTLLKRSPLRCLFILGAPGSIAPVLLRNAMYYHSWSLTSQTSDLLAFWIAPLVNQRADGTPYQITRERVKKALPAASAVAAAIVYGRGGR